jgi:hypothetical protein
MSEKESSTVLCLGLPGSASTWIFNICADLLILSYESVGSLYADRFNDIAATLDTCKSSSSALVIKSHIADEGFARHFSKANAKCILSIRDPRDCILSLMDRFYIPFDIALLRLVDSCNALLRFRESGAPLFRYEDMFYDSQQTIVAIHKYLQLTSNVDFEALYRGNHKEAVMSFIEKFDKLPQERIQKLSAFDSYDRSTHWHTRHFGDGQSGKWKSRFSPEQKIKIHQLLGSALNAMGYCDTLDEPVVSDLKILSDVEFSEA